MNNFFQKCVDITRHPASTLGGLVAGTTSLSLFISVLQQFCDQISKVPRMPQSLVANFHNTSVILASLAAIAMIVVSNGRSLSELFAGYPPQPPNSGVPNTIPFPLAAMPQNPPLQIVEQKAA